MDRYEKSAAEIMKRGDIMIAGKKRRAALIRRTTFAVSGMSAAVIVGFGIWNNVPLRNAIDRENSAYSDSELLPGTSDESAQTVVPAGSTTVHTTRSSETETVTTAVGLVTSQIAVPVTTDIPPQTVVPVQSVQTTGATDRPGNTVTTVVPGTTVPVPVTTSAAPDTTGEVPVTTSAVPETTRGIPDTTSLPGTGMAPVTTSAVPATTWGRPITTSAVPQTFPAASTMSPSSETTSTTTDQTTTSTTVTQTDPFDDQTPETTQTTTAVTTAQETYYREEIKMYIRSAVYL